jgi:hypothetical protein
VWIPSVVLSSSASESTVNENWYSLFKVVIYSSGLVKWTPGGTFKTNCYNIEESSIAKKLNCTFSFRDWLHTNDEVALIFLNGSKANTDKTEYEIQEQYFFFDELVTTTGVYSRVNFTIITSQEESELAYSIWLVSWALQLIMMACFFNINEDTNMIAFEIVFFSIFCIAFRSR